MAKEIENNTWSKVIKPTESLFRFNFKELWHYRDLVILFIQRDFTSVYRQTVLGFLWHFIQPLLTTLVFVLLGSFANLPTDNLPRILFYMTGVVLWNYFASCFTKTSNTFVGNTHLFGKVYFPRLAVPISVIISNLLGFFIQLSLLIPFLVYYRNSIHPNIFLVFIPLIIPVLAIMGLGFGLIVSSVTIKYRDFIYLVSFGVQLGMYMTPVIYPLSMVPGKFKYIASLNPISPVLELFRYAVLGRGTFTPLSLCYSLVFSIVIIFIGILSFNKVERNFMDTV